MSVSIRGWNEAIIMSNFGVFIACTVSQGQKKFIFNAGDKIKEHSVGECSTWARE